MDDYTREMMDLKTLVTRTLEKKGVLAKIRVITQFSFWFSLYIDDKLESRRIILIVNFKFSCLELIDLESSFLFFWLDLVPWEKNGTFFLCLIE